MKRTFTRLVVGPLVALGALVQIPAAHAQVNSTEGNALIFQVNGTERARISDTAGNVGIGTTNPLAKLTVSGDISSAGVVQVSGSTLTCSSSVKGSIRYSNTSSTLEYCNSTAWSSLGPSDTAPVSFRVIKSSNQTVTTSTWTMVTWQTENFDTNNNFASNRFTATVPGKYIFQASVYCNDSSGVCAASIYKNGTIYAQNNGYPSGVVAFGNVVTIIDMNVNDYVEAWGYNGGGTTLIGQNATSYFSGSIIGPQSGSGGATPAGSTGAVQFNSGGSFAGDTSNLFWDDTNNRLGVGTASPGATLHVSSTGVYPQVRLSSGLYSAAYWDIGHNASVATNDYGLSFQRSGTEYFVLGNQATGANYFPNGNVGIGLQTPTAKLDVSGSTALRSNATVGYVSGQTAGLFLTTSSTYGVPAVQGVTTGFGVGPMALNPSGGFVGIGIVSPVTALHISSSAAYAQFNVSSGSGSLRFFGGYTNGYSYIEAGNQNFTANNNGLVLTGYNANTMPSFEVQATTSVFTGNVGIGRANTGYPLQVASQADGPTSSGLRIDASDYGSGANYMIFNKNSGIGTAGTIQVGDSINNAPLALNPNGGKVGIGTTTPTINTTGQVVHVAHSTTGAAAIHFTNSSTGSNGSDGLILARWDDGSNLLWTYENEPLYIATNATPRITVLGGGTVGIDNTSPVYKLDVGNGSLSSSVYINTKGIVSANGFSTRQGVGGSIGASSHNIYWTGSAAQLWIDTTNVGTITLSSDRRVKKDIETLHVESGLSVIEKLKPVSFHWKNPESGTELQYGFIAQDMRKVLPDLVRNTGMKSPETPDGLLRIEYNGLFAPMVKAIQELKAANDNLANQTEDLKAQIKGMEVKLKALSR